MSSKFSVKDVATLNWNIKNFCSLTDLKMSSKFYSQNNRHPFYLFINPNQTGDHATLLLNVLEKGIPEMHLRYQVAILDATGQKQHIHNCEWNYKQEVDPYDHTEYVSYETCCQHLIDGTLKLFCEVNILDAEETTVVDKLDISEDFGQLLETGKLSDFIITAGGKDFNVHKSILGARSTVFCALFEHKDTKEVKEGRISIEDVSSDVCEVMLRHIYTGSIPSNMSEYAFDLFVAADKYQLTKLKLVCEQALVTLLDTNSVCSVLLIADGCNATELKEKCVDFITLNSAEVMKTEGWKQIMAKNDLLVELFQNLSFKAQPLLEAKK